MAIPEHDPTVRPNLQPIFDSTTGADGSKPGLPATKVDSVSGVTMNPGQNVAAVIAAQANDGRKGYRP